MAESDLEVRIRLKNEAEGVIDDFNENLKETGEAIGEITKATNKLGDTTGADDLAKQIQVITEAFKTLNSVGQDAREKSIGEIIGKLAERAGIAAKDFSGFIDKIVANFFKLATEARNADDAIGDKFLGNIGLGLQQMSSSGVFKGVVDQLGELEKKGADGGDALQPVIDALSKAANQAGVTANTFSSFIDGVVTEFENLAKVTAASGDTALSGGLAKMAASIKEFAAAPEFDELVGKFKEVEKAAGMEALDTEALASISSELRQMEAATDPAIAAQIRLEEQTKLYEKALRAGFLTQDEFNKKIAELSEAKTDTSALERLSEDLRKMEAAADPALAAQIKLEEQTKKYEAALKEGLVTQEEFNKKIAELGQVGKQKVDTSQLEKIAAGLREVQMATDPALRAEVKLEEQTKKLEQAFAAGLLKPKAFNEEIKKLHSTAEKGGGILDAFKERILSIAAGFGIGEIALRLFDKILDSIKDGIQEAAQTQRLNTALEALAASTKRTSSELDQAVASLEKLGFSGGASREAVVKLTQAELEFVSVLELGQAARNQAAITGQQESQVLETLINGISNRNARALRGVGITINQEEAERKYALALGKTSDQLTKAQSQFAIYQGILEKTNLASTAAEKGADNLSTLLNKLAVQTAATSETLATPFIPLLSTVTKLDTELLKLLDTLSKFTLIRPTGLFLLDLVLKSATLVVARLNKASQPAADAAEHLGEAINLALMSELRKLGVITQEELDKVVAEFNKKRKELAAKQQAGKEGSLIKPIAEPSGEALRKNIESLTGSQTKIKDGFTNLSDSGRKAVDSLADAWNDFNADFEMGGAAVVQTAGQMSQAIFAAFSKQQTFDDFNNLAAELARQMDKGTEAFKALNKELRIAQEGKLLEQMNIEVKGYLATTEKIVSLQKVWVSTLKQVVDHELAIRKFVAEVQQDREAIVALETRQRAIALNLAEAEHNDAITRINERHQTEVANAKLFARNKEELDSRLALAEKTRIEATTTQTKTYFDGLKKQQADYLQQYIDTTKKIIDLENQKNQNIRTGEQLIRNIRRQGMTEQESADDTRLELDQRSQALREAAARGDLARVKEEIDAVKSLAQAFSGVQGKGNTVARKEAIQFIEEANEAQKQLDEQAKKTEVDRRTELLQTLQQMQAAVDKVQTQLVNLVAKQITMSVALIVDQKSLDAAIKSIKAALEVTGSLFRAQTAPATVNASVEAAAAKTAGVPIPVQPDPDSLKALPTKIIDATKGTTAQVKVEPDPASLKTTTQAINAVAKDTTAKVKIEPDQAALEKDIRKIEAERARIRALPFRADPDSLKTATKEIDGAIQTAISMNPAKLTIKPDPASLTATTTEIDGALQTSVSMIPIKPDPASIVATTEEIDGALHTTVSMIPVKPDPASLATSTTAIKNSVSAVPVTFPVKPDPASLATSDKAIEDSLAPTVSLFPIKPDPVTLGTSATAIKDAVSGTPVLFPVNAEPGSLTNAATTIKEAVSSAVAMVKVVADPATIDAAVTAIKTAINAVTAVFKAVVDPASVEAAATAIRTAINAITTLFKVIVDPASIEAAIVSIKNAIGAVVASFQVAVDPASIAAAISQIQSALSAASFVVTVKTQTTGGGSSSSSGGATAEFAKGGTVSGYSPTSTSDNILGWLSANEFVQPVRAVKYYGSQFMEDIRTLRFPKLAEGGFPSTVGMNTFKDNAVSGTGVTDPANRMELVLTLDNKRSGSVFGSRETVTELTRFLKKVGAQ